MIDTIKNVLTIGLLLVKFMVACLMLLAGMVSVTFALINLFVSAWRQFRGSK
jgi:hypothetical protein